MTALGSMLFSCFFCEDIREEKAGTDTIIGILPDNLAISALPGSIPKLAMYVRFSAPLDKVPEKIQFTLRVPWSDQPLVESAMPRDQIDEGVKKAKSDGSPLVTFIMRAVMVPFQIRGTGRIQLIGRIDGQETLLAFLNIKAGS